MKIGYFPNQINTRSTIRKTYVDNKIISSLDIGHLLMGLEFNQV